ncbi:MAG: phosphatase PAP2 family protein [Acidimicrobiales bacterium]
MVTLIVVLVGMAVAAAVTLSSRRGALPAGELDTDRQERWFVQHAPARLQQLLRHLDRRVAGGAAVAIGFGVVFSAALVLGVLLDAIDRNLAVARLDRAAARWGADNATDTSTAILEAITQAGSTRMLVALMIVIGVVAALRHRSFAVLGYLLLVGLGVSLLNSGLKELVNRERPGVAMLTSYSGASFPSGHSAAAGACWAAMALILSRHRGRWVRRTTAAGAALIAGAVAASRVLLGVHWLSDVVAGVVVGWTWFFLVTLLFGGRLLRFGEPAERVERRSRRRRFGDEPSTATLR